MSGVILALRTVTMPNERYTGIESAAGGGRPQGRYVTTFELARCLTDQ